MTGKLSGKVALVTGGSRGIGAAIVLLLAEDGADVVFSYAGSADAAEKVVRQVESLGVRSLAVKPDQADPTQAARLVRTAHEQFDCLDILVNSAALRSWGPSTMTEHLGSREKASS
jgi:3-oxoacyl-[acyl-carrier protein] reductase